MRKGIFIVFEGPDGAGKTTQLERAFSYIQSKNYAPIKSREPGGTRIGDKIREVILNPDLQEMDDITEAMLYAAARRQHVQQIIRPALLDGKIVLCDRFLASSIAYQGYARGIGETIIRDINAYAVADCHPDYTFIFDVPTEIGLERVHKRNEQPDRLEKEHIEFHKVVRNAFLEMASEDPEKYIIIDASEDEEHVSKSMLIALKICLEKWGVSNHEDRQR